MYLRQWMLSLSLLVFASVPPAIAAEKKLYGLDVEFLLGENQWQPGRHYRSGNDWLALVCVKNTCRLEPAKLTVRKEKQQGHYDETPSNGQQLTFSRKKSGAATALGWFKRNQKLPWLKPGPVVTYATGTSNIKRPDSEGTLETAIDLPDGRRTSLVPLYDQKNRIFLLQLREPGKRQLLDAMGSCAHEITTDYLVWAGDLDHDGKPDYLINFDDGGGEAKLYLGKTAAPGEIVGVAGSYSVPFGGECDGFGWLE